MASTDALPVPRKNVAYRIYFGIYKNDGTLITGATGLDSEVSKDGAAYADCTNEATEIGSSGTYYLDLTSTEMNADNVMLVVKTSSTGAVIPTFSINPQETGDIKVDVTSYGGTAGTFASGRPEVNTTHAAGTAWNSGAIGAATLASDTIAAAKIATGAITAAKFAAGAIDAAAIADGAIDAGAFAADAITAAKIASDVTTELQSGLATAANLATVAGYIDTEVASILAAVDTEVAAIKAVTDLLPDAGALTSLATQASVNTIDGIVDAILVDTAEIGVAGAGLTALATQASVDAIDNLLDTEMPALTAAVADLPTNAELATALAAADDAVLAILGTPAGVSVSADIAAVKSDTAAILTDTGTTLDGKIDTIDTVVDAIKANTDKFANLPVLTAGGTGGQGYGAP